MKLPVIPDYDGDEPLRNAVSDMSAWWLRHRMPGEFPLEFTEAAIRLGRKLGRIEEREAQEARKRSGR